MSTPSRCLRTDLCVRPVEKSVVMLFLIRSASTNSNVARVCLDGDIESVVIEWVLSKLLWTNMIKVS